MPRGRRGSCSAPSTPRACRARPSATPAKPAPAPSGNDEYPCLNRHRPHREIGRSISDRDGVYTAMHLTDEAAFREATEPLRRELELHCYRMLGSVQDAEDLVQETFLAAWRGLESFEGRASLRTWLYKIATNRCLNFLRDASRRPDEVELPETEHPEPTRADEAPWLQPYPDDPHEAYEAREAIGLAFISGLQHLPPAQRATLVLRDVLGFRATEV